MFRWWISRKEKQIMLAIAQGATLKSHRDINGGKIYRLTMIRNEKNGEAERCEIIDYKVVQTLLQRKLITTNQKFPAATFLLTSKGQARIKRWQTGLRGVGAVVHFDS